MTTPDDVPHADASDLQGPAPVSVFFRHRLAALRIRLGRLWPEVKRFGRWLESQALPAARRAGKDTAYLQIRPDGEILLLGVNLPGSARALDNCGRLCAFLRGLGLERLELDVRLEHNQISDILTLLFAHRRALSSRDGGGRRHAFAARLLGGAPVQFACTQTQIRGNRLAISYSYCQTRFSRFVSRFEQRCRQFSDHRALFRAAPRYGLLPVAIAAGLFLMHTLYENWWLLLGVTAAGAAALFAMAYVFFMVVGSIEYDNEEKAYRLEKAYGDLQRYAGRVADDLARARTVQQKLLPDLARMPLADRIDWAGSFLPETEVGGDYFDAAEMDGGGVAILFADVSGHGMAAALITAILKSGFQDWTHDNYDLPEFVRRVNRNLYRLVPDGSFAALFAAIYDDRTRELTYCNCGHNPEPWVMPARADEPIRTLSDARMMLLGVEQTVDLNVSRRRLEPGDKVVLATDGLVDAQRVDGERFSQRRLEELLRSCRDRPVEELVEAAVKEIANFARGAEQTDDRTVLAFQIK